MSAPHADIAPPPAEVVAADVARALAEDLGTGDVTAALLPDVRDTAYLVCKEPAVICGRPWFDACHRALDPEVAIYGEENRLWSGDEARAFARIAGIPSLLPSRRGNSRCGRPAG